MSEQIDIYRGLLDQVENEGLSPRVAMESILSMIDGRLAQTEATSLTAAAVINQALDEARANLEEQLSPFFGEIERLVSLGVLFEATSETDITVGTGLKTFVIPQGIRQSFAPAATVSIAPADAPAVRMIAKTVSLDRDIGSYVVNVIETEGSGTYADWVIRPQPLGSHVVSFKGRQGLVVPLAGDYELDQITGLEAAIATLNADIAARQVSSAKGQANGYAALDAGGKVPEAQLPAVAISDVYPVASEAAMLALTAERGDVAVRSDLSKSFILSAVPATTLTNWVELRTPTDSVLTVAGRTGNVVIVWGDVGSLPAAISAIAALTPAADKSLYFTSGTNAALFDITAYGRALAGVANEAAAMLKVFGVETDVATAATADLGAVSALRLRFTGSTDVSSFGTGANQFRVCRAAASFKIVHNATSLICPGATDLFVNAGDSWIAQSTASGNWRILAFQRADDLAAKENILINGDLRIWQRGTNFINPASGTYLADRFMLSYNGTGATRVISQSALTPNNEGDSGSPFHLQWAESVAGSGATFKNLTIMLESVRTRAGKQVTFSFRATAGGATSVSPVFAQNFGTGGAPSASVFTSGAALSIGNGWAYYFVTVTLPSISGKTLGSNGNDYLSINLSLPVASPFDLTLGDFKLEDGAYRTRFVPRPFALEQAACKRFFERFGGVIADTQIGKGGADTATRALCDIDYAEKRATPVITVTGGASDFEVQRQGGAVIATTALAATAGRISRKRCQLEATVASGLTAGEWAGIKVKSVNGTIDVSAELL